MGIQAEEEDTKKDMLILCISRREREIQKKTEQILVDKQQKQQKQKQQEKQSQETSFTIVSLDESFFFYDSLVRRVWIEENKRPLLLE
jgi:thymidine kinase